MVYRSDPALPSADIDEFCDLMRDVIKISTQDVSVNEHAIELLEAVHDSQRTLVKRLS